ncbi:MAG: glycosyltransferase, partial [Propionibacteriaceae bacterium]|nr:glycosyltransferase [Propionibacteriaceae bacterium]
MKTFPALEPNPGISYIMPVLNEAEYLETAVASIYMQKYGGEREIILALGTSSDDTDVIAKRLAAHDSQLKLVQNPKNDVSIGLNLAIKASRYPV